MKSRGIVAPDLLVGFTIQVNGGYSGNAKEGKSEEVLVLVRETLQIK